MTDLLFNVEPTTDGGLLMNCTEMHDRMLYRDVYKREARFVFAGKDYTAYFYINTSRGIRRPLALKMVSQYIEKNLRGKS